VVIILAVLSGLRRLPLTPHAGEGRSGLADVEGTTSDSEGVSIGVGEGDGVSMYVGDGDGDGVSIGVGVGVAIVVGVLEATYNN
jgi:hypothetical protein